MPALHTVAKVSWCYACRCVCWLQGEFGLDLVALDDDVLSLELEGSFRWAPGLTEDMVKAHASGLRSQGVGLKGFGTSLHQGAHGTCHVIVIPAVPYPLRPVRCSWHRLRPCISLHGCRLLLVQPAQLH